MIITKDNTIAEVVTDNIKTADVFKKFNIDFCCGGGISIEKACEKKGITATELLEKLATVSSTNTPAKYNYKSWDMGFLIDHSESIPILMQYANKVANVHGHHYAEVIEINDLFTEVAEELKNHMVKEELVLFPYIKSMLESEKTNSPLKSAHFGSVKNPVGMMEHEHEGAGDIFKRIAEITHQYTPPEGACNTFRALYAKLDEFEQDLHHHIHLENNILHPKAIDLELKLRSI